MVRTKYWRSNVNRKYILSAVEECKDIILFDTETTGFKKSDYIIEIAAIKYHIDDSYRITETDRLHKYIKPPFSVSEEIEKLTGITNEFLSDKPSEEDLFDEIKAFFENCPIISAYNSSFDIRMMSSMYGRNNETFPVPKFEIDVLKMARDIVKPDETNSYKLGEVAHTFGLDEGVEFHSAIEDVTVTARLFEYFIKEYAEIEANCKETSGVIKPKIESVAYWQGYKGFSRIYVNTDYGSVYFDTRRQNWLPKNDEMSIEQIDMEFLQSEVLKITNSSNLNEFARFTGKIRL